LIVEDVDIINPKDIAYTYNGYAPLSIRFLEHLLNFGTRSPQCISIT